MKKRLLPYLFVFASILVGLSACKKDDKDKDTNPSVDQTAFLVNSSAIIQTSYLDYANELGQLQAAVDTFAALPSSFQLSKLRTALKSTYLAWQTINFYEFGPAENASLKSHLNIHPTDTTKIEYNISTSVYDLSILSNKTAKGFPAMDYLLNSKADSITLASFKKDSSRI